MSRPHRPGLRSYLGSRNLYFVWWVMYLLPSLLYIFYNRQLRFAQVDIPVHIWCFFDCAILSTLFDSFLCIFFLFVLSSLSYIWLIACIFEFCYFSVFIFFCENSFFPIFHHHVDSDPVVAGLLQINQHVFFIVVSLIIYTFCYLNALWEEFVIMFAPNSFAGARNVDHFWWSILLF